MTNRVPLSFLCTLYYFILDESDNWSVTWRIEAGAQAFVEARWKKCRVRFGGGGGVERETRRAIRLYERDTVQCRFRARPRYRVPLSSDVAVSGSSITNVSLKNCLSDSSRAIVLNDSRTKCWDARINSRKENLPRVVYYAKKTVIIVPIAHVARACKWWGLFGSKSEQKITRSRISPLLSFASIRYYVIPRTIISSFYTDVIKLIVDTITRCTFSFRELLFSYIIHVMYIYILISWLD